MIKSLTLIPKSIDPQYLDDILPNLIHSMKQSKGLVEITGNQGPLMSPGGPPAYSIVVEASWTSLEDFMAWAQTSAAQKDKDFMITSGAALLFYEQKDL